MPQLGMYMVEGTMARWLVPSGASVKAGDAVLEIENEKATTEIVAPADGVVEQVASAGEIVPVRGVLGRVLGASEMRGDSVGADASRAPAATQAAPAPAPTSSPAGELVLSGVEGIKASPLARKLAAQHGVDLATLTGTGPGGRISEADVQAAVEKAAVLPKAPERSVLRRIPLAGRRKVIAQRMTASLTTAAQLTVMREVDASALVQARQALAARAAELGVRVSYDAILAKALAAALKEQPVLNAAIEGEEIVVLDEVHVGIATATPAGLVVPVVHDADTLSLVAVARAIEEFAARAAGGKLLPDEMAGGTVTITNIGLFGIDTFTPILNPPESAILGVGRIAPRPVVSDGGLFIRPTVHLSLTWDHRVADGAEAGLLVGRVAELIGDPGYLAKLA
jgi:pyruvate/2-oxoglutarate dehydrogenase complex dihydrolipoamide acyltransferase (E2) component